MSIKLTPFNYNDLCFGHTWTIEDQSALAINIGGVALGQSWRVQQILAGAKLGPQPTSAAALAGAIELLSVSGADPWHRDGWMFQVMSWIAARTISPQGLIRPPHMIHAHKGFDGLELEVGADGLVKAAIIFEDKATDSPRDVIRDEVWQDFKSFEKGKSENVLVAEVVTLLHKGRVNRRAIHRQDKEIREFMDERQPLEPFSSVIMRVQAAISAGALKG